MDSDVIIIGGGAAGLTAGIFCARKKLKTQVITIDIGGQTNLATHIANYPGHLAGSGNDLMCNMQKQAEDAGAKFTYGKVEQIIKHDAKHFEVILTNKETYKAICIILALGKVPRELNIPGEKEFLGRGIAICTAKLDQCKDKNVVIVGGGNTAIEAARDLAPIAKHITVVHRREGFRADETTLQNVQRKENVAFMLNAQATEVRGHKQIEKVVINNETTLDVDQMFIEIGYVTATKFIKELVKLNERGEIIIDEKCQTSEEGIFAAGDVTTVPFKQTVISAGEGAKAALEAYKYISGGKGASLDWC